MANANRDENNVPVILGTSSVDNITPVQVQVNPVTGRMKIQISGGTGSSPLTTKGDLYTFDTADARLPVGTDGQALVADSAQPLGVKWSTPAGGGDMTAAVYDPAGVTEQLVGLTAIQTLTNKTLTSPVINTPTGIVKGDVGLGNVDNTSDANKPVSTAQQTALDLKVDENIAIIGATKTKITYDAKGLVTSGADATTADIAASTDKNYVTDAEAIVIGNTSNTNTGDQTSIVGISGTTAQFNTALSDGSFATGGGTATGTNTGDQTSIVGITGTTAQFNTALSDGSFATGGGTATGTNTGDQDLSTYATKTGAETLTNKRITERVNTIASSATPTPAGDTTDLFTVTALAVAAAFAAPTGTPTEGQVLLIRIKDNATARALTWNAIYRASTDLPLPTTTILSKTLYLQFVYSDTDSKWDLLGLLNNF